MCSQPSGLRMARPFAREKAPKYWEKSGGGGGTMSQKNDTSHEWKDR